MTPKMKECLEAIERLTVDGVPPSYDELKLALGVSNRSRVHRLIGALAERGLVTMLPGKRRSVRVVSSEQVVGACYAAARPKAKRPTKRPEQALQQRVCRYIDLAYPGLTYFHVPNSTGNRGAHLGGIMRSMGVKAGVPDLVFVIPTGRVGFIELKAGKGKLTESQEAFRDKVRESGAWWSEARSVAEVAEILEKWLLPFGWVPKARVAA